MWLCDGRGTSAQTEYTNDLKDKFTGWACRLGKYIDRSRSQATESPAVEVAGQLLEQLEKAVPRNTEPRPKSFFTPLNDMNRPYYGMLGTVADIQKKGGEYITRIEQSGDLDASLALLLAVTAVASLCLGRYSLTGTEVMAVLLPDGWLSVETNRMMENIVLNVRLPRVLLAIIAGAGLAMSGAAFQALFANPLAAPDTLGVATGASFGAVLGILWGWNGMGIQLMSLATGLSAVFFVIVISRVRNTSSILMIILSGMVVGALFSALVSLVKYAADPQDVLPSITFWMMGALTGATKSSVLAGTPMVLLGMLVLWLLRWRLNVTTLPTDEAASLGIPVRRIRAGVIIAATMITASVVSMCGLIGWVGLLVPHAARMVFGANNRFVLPASMVMGALFMLVIDTVARTATQSEIPVSILTAVVGAPFFIYLLRRTGGISG